MKYQIEDVFSPRSFPQNTYISRIGANGETVDDRLRKALAMKGNLIFVSGASKSGKTVLCHNVIDEDKFISLSGNQINSREDFWSHIAEQIPLSDTVTTVIMQQDNAAALQKFGVNFMGFSAGIGKTEGNTAGKQLSVVNARTERQIIKYLIDNHKILVIDDFHYVAKDVQMYIARTLKTELFNGLKAVIISLPHRSDEAIICNPDLIGRTTSIEIPPWSAGELKEIADKGFALLDIELSNGCVDLLAQESISSPQLMQDNCFNLAFNIINKNDGHDIIAVQAAFHETARNYSHYERIVNSISTGPIQGINRRKQYLVEYDNVDVYKLLLLALKADPPVTELTLVELKDRVRNLVKGNDLPTTSILSATINKAIEIISANIPDLDALEYKNQKLYILDPFLLFYLRWKN